MKFVPFTGLADFAALFGKRHSLLAFLVVRWKKPAAPRLIINARRPHPATRRVHVNFDLITVDAVRRDFDFLAADVQRARFGENFAADLHAGIQQRVALVFQFKLEVLKRLRRAKETVARIGNGFARQHASFNSVFRLAAVPGPAVEIFSVEKIHPAVFNARGLANVNTAKKT